MPINKTLITLFLVPSVLSSVLSSAQNKGKTYKNMTPPTPKVVIPYKYSTLNAPPGMVYIRGGSTKIKYNQSASDTNSIKKVSLTSFFIDKTEVTNEQYRQFTNWVIDSIAIVKYLRDDEYFLEESDKNSSKSGSSSNSDNNNSANNNNNKNSNNSASTPPPPVSIDTSGFNPGGTVAAPPPPAATPADTSAMPATVAADQPAITGKRINWAKVSHNKIFNSKDEDIKSKIAPMLDENGKVKRELYVFNYRYMKPNNVKSRKAEYKTVPVNIYPNEAVWSQDLTNAQTDLYVENYFTAPPFNDYPVVGVDWVQANAFAYWRSIAETSYNIMPPYMKYYHLTYTLPSEAQWVYAAEGYYDMLEAPDSLIDSLDKMVTHDTTMTPHSDSMIAATLAATKPTSTVDSAKQAAREDRLERKRKAKRGNYYLADYFRFGMAKYGGKYKGQGAEGDLGGPYVDSTVVHKDPNGMLENFKQNEGEYWEDGSALTTPVMSFAPNEFGLYNMEGNVAEWVMDAYSPSTYAFVSDLNPCLQYDADSTDADAMKRKVVRGGSFMGNPASLTPYYRDLELQNVSHCFIGFRCVMQAPEILYKNVATRRHTMRGKQVKYRMWGNRLPEIH